MRKDENISKILISEENINKKVKELAQKINISAKAISIYENN